MEKKNNQIKNERDVSKVSNVLVILSFDEKLNKNYEKIGPWLWGSITKHGTVLYAMSIIIIKKYICTVQYINEEMLKI